MITEMSRKFITQKENNARNLQLLKVDNDANNIPKKWMKHLYIFLNHGSFPFQQFLLKYTPHLREIISEFNS